MPLIWSGRAAVTPVEVEARINGQSWRALVDSWGHTRSFGNRSITIRGRGLAAYLANPYAVPRSYTEGNVRLAQQLAAQELPTGWSLDWRLEDWTVPAGAWSYERRTPIEALSAIAAAAGGYIQGDQIGKTIHVLPGYPVAPWGWADATPDITLPADVITQLGQDWQPVSEANEVYVSGREQGVLVQVRRAGTAGDKSLPLVVDPLITEVAAARQRGIAELGATGPQSREKLSLPLDNSIAGLLSTGQLIQVTGAEASPWRGLVRGVSVSAGRNSGALQVSQQIEVERHAA